MNLRIYILLILFSQTLFAQQSKTPNNLMSFESAVSFSISPSGNIYVTDNSTSEITKLDTLGNKLATFGGYGWDNEGLDNPVHVFADQLKIYVTDKNNNRIQIFDKDLNYISSLKTELLSSPFSYPENCVASSQGDIFIYDSENSRIVKLNSGGEFVSEFGNYDYGDYSLEGNNSITVSQDNKLFVTNVEFLLIFDQYGNGVTKIKTGLENPSVNIFRDILVISNNEKIKYLNLRNPGKGFTSVNTDFSESEITDALIYKGSLYYLTHKNIFKVTLKKSK